MKRTKNNIPAQSFTSPYKIRDMIGPLKTLPGFEWSLRESEYDDVYIKGMTPQGIKIRILEYPKNFELEIYFPIENEQSMLSEDQKEAFLQNTVPEILKVVQAENIKVEN